MEYRILGSIEVVGPGGRLDLGTHKLQALLAVLLVNANRVVAVDRVIDQLWGEEPPPSAMSSLQAYISNLRRILEPDRPSRQPPQLLITQPPGYMLRVEPGELDGARFEALVAEGQRRLEAGDPESARTAIESATALWRGPPFSQLEGETFVLREVERLTELRAAAEETAWEADLVLGRHARVVASLHAGVAAEPLRERRWWLLMLALYRCDRQADALRAYQDARSRLGEELGIEPSVALQRLEREILEHDVSLEWRSVPVTAPAQPPPVRASAAGVDPVGQPIGTDSGFVGRTDQLARLDKLWTETRGGRGAVVLITGEAGIGKTRLAEELASRVAGDGGGVAWGRCQEREGAPAYWPWLQVLQQVEGLTIHDALSRLGLSGSESHDRPAGPRAELVWSAVYTASLAPEAARFPVYDAMVRLLLVWASGAPAVVVLEDLHWADVASLGVLELLAPAVRAAPLLVVCTYREDDAAPGHPLETTLGALAREPSTQRVPLQGLEVDEVAMYAHIAADLKISERSATQLRERTDGNPFFLAEVVRLMTSEGRGAGDVDGLDVPAGVRDVIRRRLARLPDDVRALLGVASIVGRDFDPDILGPACGVDAESVLDLLDTAFTTRLIRSQGGMAGGYRFTHALVRDTLYEEQTPVRRARLHGRVADAVRDRPTVDPQSRLSDLAHHYVRAVPAGRAKEALEYTRRAAEHADSQQAYEQAVDFWRLALDAATAADGVDERGRYDLLMGLAWSQRRANDVEQSFDTFARAARAAEAAGDPVRMAVAVVAMGTVAAWTWRYNGNATFVGLIRRALAGVEDDPTGRALLLSVLADELSGLGEHDAAHEACATALALADLQAEPFVQFAALAARATTTAADGDIADRIETARRLVELDGLPPEAQFVAHMDARGIHLENADLDTSDRELRYCDGLASAMRVPFLGFQMAANKAGRALVRGEFEEAERLSGEMLDRYYDPGSSIAFDVYSGHLFLLRWMQGRLVELESAFATMGAERVSGAFRAAEAVAQLVFGRPDAARRLVEEAIRLPLRIRDFTWVVTSCLLGHSVASLADVAQFDAETATLLYEDLSPFTGQVAVTASGVACIGAVDLYLGRLAMVLGRPSGAREHLELALDVNQRIGARPWLAWTRYWLASLPDVSVSERNDLLAEAAAAAADLGMAPLVTATATSRPV